VDPGCPAGRVRHVELPQYRLPSGPSTAGKIEISCLRRGAIESGDESLIHGSVPSKGVGAPAKERGIVSGLDLCIDESLSSGHERFDHAFRKGPRGSVAQSRVGQPPRELEFEGGAPASRGNGAGHRQGRERYRGLEKMPSRQPQWTRHHRVSLIGERADDVLRRLEAALRPLVSFAAREFRGVSQTLL
jgi:hypothetical protein